MVVMWFVFMFFFFFKQKTAYEMRISDWSSDVCSSDLVIERRLDSGDTAGAMSLLQRATAEIVALNTNGQFATAAVARQRLRLIYLLARAGHVREAEQLASS